MGREAYDTSLTADGSDAVAAAVAPGTGAAPAPLAGVFAGSTLVDPLAAGTYGNDPEARNKLNKRSDLMNIHACARLHLPHRDLALPGEDCVTICACATPPPKCPTMTRSPATRPGLFAASAPTCPRTPPTPRSLNRVNRPTAGRHRRPPRATTRVPAPTGRTPNGRRAMAPLTPRPSRYAKRESPTAAGLRAPAPRKPPTTL